MKMANLATLSSPRSRLVSFSFSAVRSVSPKSVKGGSAVDTARSIACPSTCQLSKLMLRS